MKTILKHISYLFLTIITFSASAFAQKTVSCPGGLAAGIKNMKISYNTKEVEYNVFKVTPQMSMPNCFSAVTKRLIQSNYIGALNVKMRFEDGSYYVDLTEMKGDQIPFETIFGAATDLVPGVSYPEGFHYGGNYPYGKHVRKYSDTVHATFNQILRTIGINVTDTLILHKNTKPKVVPPSAKRPSARIQVNSVTPNQAVTGTINVSFTYSNPVNFNVSSFALLTNGPNTQEVNANVRTIALDTSTIRNGNSRLTVRATGYDSNNRKAYAFSSAMNIVVNNENYTPPTPSPTPEATPVPPTSGGGDNTPPISGEDNQGINQLMNLLVQMLSQLMEILTALNTSSTTSTRSLTNQYNLETVSEFSDVVKANRHEFKKNKELKSIPRLTKRFSKSFKKAQKISGEKKRAKLMKKSNRILGKIMKRTLRNL